MTVCRTLSQYVTPGPPIPGAIYSTKPACQLRLSGQTIGRKQAQANECHGNAAFAFKEQFNLRIHGKQLFVKDTRGLVAILALVLTASCAGGQASSQRAPQPPVWFESWGTSQQVPEPQNALPTEDLRDATVRQIFHLSAGGSTMRVHVSNAFGTEVLHFTSIHIARPLASSSPAIEPASDRPLRFAGSADVTVPPGAEFISDPLDEAVAPLSDIAVTFHLDAPPAIQTGHPGSRATSYYVHGDLVSAQTLTDAKHVDHSYQISEIDVQGGRAEHRWSLLAIRSLMEMGPRRTETIAGRMCWPLGSREPPRRAL